ncbi:hypothetical protein AAMO2058_000992800 [Amorphochlora amoebiformis]
MMMRRPQKEEEGKEKKVIPAKAKGISTSEEPKGSCTTNTWVILGVIGWFLVVYKGAQLTKRHGLHYPVVNYLGIGIGASPIIPGLSYTILADMRKTLLVCGDDGFCSQVPATSQNVRKSCFAASEINDNMDDKGGLTTSHIFYIAYVCPGKNYGKWLSYHMSNNPYKKALRLKLFNKKFDASPWRLYKDAEGHKLQCFQDGPGMDHWIGVHSETGAGILVDHSDTVGPSTRHSAFVFAMIADSHPSSRLSYSLFNEAMKGFLTCNSAGICRVSRKQDSVGSSCWVVQRATGKGAQHDHYQIRYDCPGSGENYLSTVTQDGKIHVGLSQDTETRWKILPSNNTGSQITLLTGPYKGYTLGPESSKGRSKKDFFFVRRIDLNSTKDEEEGKEELEEKPMGVDASISKKYSKAGKKFVGCFKDKSNSSWECTIRAVVVTRMESTARQMLLNAETKRMKC